MKKRIITILLILINIQLFANGGPIDGSAVVKTGRIKMINHWGINITSEKIDLKIDGDFAIYDITYTFYKEDNDKDSVTYGFPVDFTQADVVDEFGYNFYDEYIPYFKMYFQQKELQIQQQIDFGMNMDSLLISSGFDSRARFHKVVCKTKWYISQIFFEKKGFYELKVQYKVKNFFTDMLYSKSFLPRYTKRYLKYDLTPAAFWDEGIIDTFLLRINVQNLDSCNETYIFAGLSDTKLENGIIEFKHDSLKLNEVKFFTLQYTNSNQNLSKYVIQGILPKQGIKSIKTSGKDKMNMLDLDFSKPLKIKKDKSIEFDLDSSKIAVIYLINGDYSNQDNYNKHNKIGKIRISSDYIYLDNYGNPHKLDTIIQLKNHQFKELREDNFVSNADLLWDFGMADIIGKITITVVEPLIANKKEIYISEIIFAIDKWSKQD